MAKARQRVAHVTSAGVVDRARLRRLLDKKVLRRAERAVNVPARHFRHDTHLGEGLFSTLLRGRRVSGLRPLRRGKVESVRHDIAMSTQSEEQRVVAYCGE